MTFPARIAAWLTRPVRKVRRLHKGAQEAARVGQEARNSLEAMRRSVAAEIEKQFKEAAR